MADRMGHAPYHPYSHYLPPNQVALSDVPTPRIIRPTDVIVKVCVGGIRMKLSLTFPIPSPSVETYVVRPVDSSTVKNPSATPTTRSSHPPH